MSVINLAFKDLTTLNSETFNSYDNSIVEEIRLEYNQIKTIEDDLFLQFPILERLVLFQNNLETIPNIPPSLKRLYVNKNKITDINNFDFKNVIRFEINDNLLTKVNPTFSDELVYCVFTGNKIEEISEDLFLNKNKLEYINIDNFPKYFNFSSNSIRLAPFRKKIQREGNEECVSCKQLSDTVDLGCEHCLCDECFTILSESNNAVCPICNFKQVQ